MNREHLKSRLGFILLSAGCAIGIGNVWKFPYVVGENGGGAFVLIYLCCLLVMGVPILTMEFSMGRASQKSPVKLYQALKPDQKGWKLHGYASFIGAYLLMMFYTIVGGWMLQYFFITASGGFEGASVSEVANIYQNMLSNPKGMVISAYALIILSSFVCMKGLQNGLEKVTKFMMLSLLGIMGILVVNSVMMDGGAEGLKFYLSFDWAKVEELGFINVVVNAMNQSFFTLSLGMGAMAIFGSYIGKERSLLGEAVSVSLLDTLVAFSSGLIIFPACSAFGVQVDSGKELVFLTLPNIFNHMPLGRFWGSLFFIFMTFAALSTILAVFEFIISCLCDLTGWSRKKASLINLGLMLVLVLPGILGFNVAIYGMDIMSWEEYLVGVYLLPLGSVIYLIFCTQAKAWGWENFVKEANEGKGLKVQSWMRPYLTYILPIIIFGIFLLGIM